MCPRMVETPPGELSTDVARVRLVLIRELETISTYEELARQASSEEIRAFFLHLAAEEKEHVAEATFLLRKLDAGQDAHFAKSYGEAHFTGQAAKPAPVDEDLRVPAHPHKMVYAVPAPPNPVAGQLTVGSLRRKG
jgi:hypothetical protein